MKSGKLFSSGTTTGNIDFAALILRLIGGGFMVYGHGAAKFSKFFYDEAIEFIDPLGISATATLGLVVFAEVICSIFILLGLMTRWALVPLIFTMFYAAFFAHSGDGFGEKELALVYLFIYFIVLLIGPGKFSLDRMIKKRRQTV